MLGGYRATVMAGGHTHVQMVRRHNDLMLVNAGSVGEPLEQMPVKDTTHILPWAEYTMISWQDGCLGIQSRRVPVDIEAFKQSVSASDMPEALREVWARIRE
jgi:diadenosine tetraphosphatase ApaH/serine/threonine PP2A family protein phosphatase